MIDVLVTVVIVLIVFGLLWWVISLIPFPANFPIWVAHVILGLVLVLILIKLLLPLIGVPVLR